MTQIDEICAVQESCHHWEQRHCHKPPRRGAFL